MKTKKQAKKKTAKTTDSQAKSTNKKKPIGVSKVKPILTVEDILNEATKHAEEFKPIAHERILAAMLNNINEVDFRKLAGITDPEKNVETRHYLICSIEELLRNIIKKNWDLCKHLSFLYMYNGAYWQQVEEEVFRKFLGEATERMGVSWVDARYYPFRAKLLKQFFSAAYLPRPNRVDGITLINLKNGTFEIGPSVQRLRPPSKDDFLQYQLHFEYTPTATATIFQSFLDRVLPDKDLQKILAEYMAYIFVPHKILNLEKALLLYGEGSNGKSVIWAILTALIGKDNISNYSLQSLTDNTGYYRAMLTNKLLNYGTEISTKVDPAFFKALVSGEPIEARLPHGRPITVTDYCKFMFNCNRLLKDVEITHAFFRRFLILPFEVIIPDEEQDKELAQKIIKAELPGVFNWVLEGLKRLLVQKNFTHSDIAAGALADYKKESDSVQLFLEDTGYIKSVEVTCTLDSLFILYRDYCYNSRYTSVSKKTFSQRLRSLGFVVKRLAYGNVIYADREQILL